MSVGPISGPVQRSSDGRDLGELFDRVQALERVKPGETVETEYIDDEATFGTGVAGNSEELVYWVHDTGDTLLDLTDPQNPVVIAAGLYTVAMTLRWVDTPGPFVSGKGGTQQLYVQRLRPIPPPRGPAAHVTWDDSLVGTAATTITWTLPLVAGDVLQHLAVNGQLGSGQVFGSGFVVRRS